MLLVIKITRTQLANYRKEFLQCLKHNSENVYINQIYVFTDDIDHKILMKKTSILFKRKIPTNDDLITEIKKISKYNKIIISDPFIQFQNDLYKVTDEDLKRNILKNQNYLIFSKNSKFYNGEFETKQTHINLSINKIKTNIQNEIEVVENKSVLIKKSIYDPNKVSPTIRNKKLDVLIVSVNYSDYLLVSLVNNIKVFENITVVTTNEDIKCQEICEKLEVNCVISERIYDDGAKFNKGKAINDGIKSLHNPDLILLLDSDIVVKEKIDLESLSDDVLYTSNRIIYKDYNSFISECNEIEEIDKGWGFFQLFCFNNPVLNKEYPFPESSETADGSDLVFRDYFEKRRSINKKVIHLGDTKQNWKGRVTERFITDQEFEKLLTIKFDINNYFDKIYCLNLDRRPDRWEKVSKQFDNLNITVERWSAVDGEMISDKLYKDIIKDDIEEKIASDLGIFENKFSIACLLSHLSIIKNAKINNYKKILIFEDDVEFSGEIDDLAKIGKLHWKLLYLGCSQFDWSNIESQGDFYFSRKTLGTFAYAIDCSLYDEIIKISENPKNKKSIDNLLSEIQASNYKKCFTLSPSLFSSNMTDSDIRGINTKTYNLELETDDDFKYIGKSLKNNRMSALQNLIDLKIVFDYYKVEYWITDGTLLGLKRDCDFISHDLDCDLGVRIEDFNPSIINKLSEFGFEILRSFGLIDNGFEISLIKNFVKIDLFFFYKEGNKLWHAAWYSTDDNDFNMIKYNYNIFDIEKSYFYGIKFNTPKNVEKYLLQKYGDDWKTKNTNWDWKFSPKNHEKTNIVVSQNKMTKDLEYLKELSEVNNQITLLIKSFKRFECLKNLLKSIRNYYPHISIVIVDDSDEEFTIEEKNVDFYRIDFDSGLSKGRNFGVSKIKTTYFILLDDDFEFTNETNLVRWLKLIKESDLDILGGDVIMNDKKMDYFGLFEFDSNTKTLNYIDGFINQYKNYKTYDFILNFFIAKTESIKKYKWDDDLKLAEHTAFFFDHKGKIKVGHTECVNINHQKVLEGEYIDYRKRGTMFFNNWMHKKDVIKTINLKGEEYTRK